MIKRIFNVLKKVIISAFAIYTYNLIVSPLNIIIPINIPTVASVSILGLPAILALTVIHFIVF